MEREREREREREGSGRERTPGPVFKFCIAEKLWSH